jgi:hypothetical protein
MRDGELQGVVAVETIALLLRRNRNFLVGYSAKCGTLTLRRFTNT